ncbi:hypothetical protein MASR2M15_27220 [Anaerolineales bacterium]
MIYEIHLYVPKLESLTPAMMEWLYEHGQDKTVPEGHWPVRKLNPRALARHVLRLDPLLVAVHGPDDDVELHFPDMNMGIILYCHDRGVIIFFPYMAYTVYSRIVLGIIYTYIRWLYDIAGFWSFDPQLELISYADDFESLEKIAILMDRMMPRQLNSG